MESQFQKDLAELINRYSKENDSDTPDFILARYLNAVLENFNAAVMDREQWYGRHRHVEDMGLVKPPDYDDTGHPPPDFPRSTTIDLNSNYLIDLNSDPITDLES